MPPPEGMPATILSLLRDGRQQARDLAETIGIDTSAVRRHLEALREEGLVDAEVVVQGVGRPKKLYGLTGAGREAFPRDYALLIDLIFAKLRDTHGHAALESLLGSIAKDLAKSLDAHASFERRLAELVAFYNKLGFEASVERTRDGYMLTQRNCIFLKAAIADAPLMCQCFDEGIMRAVLPGCRVTFDGSLATGSLRCRHLIAPPRRAAG